MKYFIPDSVADQIHEREIPDHFVAGLPLAQAVAIIDAWDGYNISGDDYLTEVPEERDYREGNNIGQLSIRTDRDHWYGIVYSPTDPAGAKKQAKLALRSMLKGAK